MEIYLKAMISNLSPSAAYAFATCPTKLKVSILTNLRELSIEILASFLLGQQSGWLVCWQTQLFDQVFGE